MSFFSQALARGIVGLAATASVTGVASAQSYPTQPIRIIVTVQPGGSQDITARRNAKILSEGLGVPVTVENRPGASGLLATEFVARAKPDGYTLVSGTMGPIVAAPTLFKDLAYDPVKDLTPAVRAVTYPLVWTVRPDLPVNNFAEFLAYVRKQPNPLRVGMIPATSPHFLLAKLEQETNTKFQIVPYKGGSGVLNDILGGHLDVNIDNTPAIVPQVRAGKLKALAIEGDTRSPLLPDVPTFKELGLPSVAINGGWHSLLAPAGTPAAIVDKLNLTLVAGLRDPQIARQIAEDGGVIVASTPEEFRQFIETEIPRLRGIAEQAGIRID